MPKKVRQTGNPRVHAELDGYKISINKFGEIRSNLDIDALNHFLNRKVDDKKLRHRADLDKIRGVDNYENDDNQST